MFIDDEDIRNLGAVLMEKDIQPSSIESEDKYLWLEKSLLPTFLKQKFKFVLVGIKLYIEGLNESDVKNKCSSLIKKSTECILNFEDDFYYKSFLITSSIENTLKKERRKLNLNFVAYAYKEEIIETINRVNSKIINASGNLETPVILEITPTNEISDITLEGLADDPIIIKKLKANKTVVVDGELQKVTVDGVNKYGDTDMWDFPRLIPGENNIQVSRNNCNITIRYKPRFI